MIRAVLFICSFCLFSLMVEAQDEQYPDGYIVSNSGDTTYGFIKSGNLFKDQKKIEFIDIYGEKVQYTSDRISAFGYGNKDYVSKKTPYLFSGVFSDSTLFLLRTVNGPAKLYRFYTRRSAFTLQKGPAYFDMIEKPDGKIYEVSYNFKWKRIADAFEDFPELSREISNGLYSMKEMEKIMSEYNVWYRER